MRIFVFCLFWMFENNWLLLWLFIHFVGSGIYASRQKTEREQKKWKIQWLVGKLGKKLSFMLVNNVYKFQFINRLK